MSDETLFYNELEALIDTVIKAERDHVIHGLLIFNLDDFAEINNLVGVDGGNEILDIISGKINEFFKGTDIVAKLRGDEYAVLVRNIRAVTDLEKLCEKILTSVSEIYVSDMQVTSSIGVSVYPFHGRTYADLLDKAYQALMRAKANGKNGYRIYESAVTKAKFSEYILNGIYGEIDYRSISGSDWDRYFMDVCRQMFRYDSNIYASLNSILEIFCLYHGFSRAFILTNGEHSVYDEKHLEFALPGCEYPNTDVMNLLKQDLVLRLYEDFDDCAIVHTDDQYTDPEILEYMRVMGDCEIVFFAVKDEGKCIGGIVYEKIEEDGNRISLNDLAKFSSQAGAIMAYALISNRFRASKDLMAKIEMFEGMPADIYIIDSENYTIEYMNSRALDAAGVSAIGSKCYKILHNFITVCEDCPLKNMNPDDTTANAKIETYNFSTCKLCLNMYSWVSGRDNKGKALLVSVDVEDLFGEV
jgi:diguanylate cyclase (GGDEF)-like protein